MEREGHHALVAEQNANIEDLYAAYCELKQENERIAAENKRLKDHINRMSEEDYNY